MKSNNTINQPNQTVMRAPNIHARDYLIISGTHEEINLIFPFSLPSLEKPLLDRLNQPFCAATLAFH